MLVDFASLGQALCVFWVGGVTSWLDWVWSYPLFSFIIINYSVPGSPSYLTHPKHADNLSYAKILWWLVLRVDVCNRFISVDLAKLERNDGFLIATTYINIMLRIQWLNAVTARFSYFVVVVVYVKYMYYSNLLLRSAERIITPRFIYKHWAQTFLSINDLTKCQQKPPDRRSSLYSTLASYTAWCHTSNRMLVQACGLRLFFLPSLSSKKRRNPRAWTSRMLSIKWISQ